jgi:hypothetical protein
MARIREFFLTKMNGKTRLWLPSVADLFFLCPFLLLVLRKGTLLLSDADTGYHIRTGEFIIEHFTVPRYDIFSSITPPPPWVAHEWLSEVIMALVHKVAGLTGVVIFFSFWIGVISFLLFTFVRSLNFDFIPATAVVLLAVVSSSLHWLARPHVFSLLLTLVWYVVLYTYQYRGKDRLYLLPFSMLLWVNLHGGFILGFVLLFIYGAGNLFGSFAEAGKRNDARRKCKRLLVVTLFTLLASLINPRGYSLLLYPFATVFNHFLMDNVVEYLSPNFHDLVPYECLLLVMIGVLALSRKGVDAIELMLLLLFTHMALYSARYIPFFAIIVAPIILGQLQFILHASAHRYASFLDQRNKNLEILEARAKGHLWPIICVTVVCALTLDGKITFGFDPAKDPVAAVEFLKREKISGRMFNDDEFGDYVIYAAWPEYRVSFDGRSDMYGENWGESYSMVFGVKPGWEKFIETNHFTWIFCRTDSLLSRALMENKNWRLIYSDRLARIFVRDIPEYRQLINKYSDVEPTILREQAS